MIILHSRAELRGGWRDERLGHIFIHLQGFSLAPVGVCTAPFHHPQQQVGEQTPGFKFLINMRGGEAVVQMHGAARSPDVLASGRDACWCGTQCRNEEPDPKSQHGAGLCPEPLPPEAPALLVAEALPALVLGLSPKGGIGPSTSPQQGLEVLPPAALQR